ncbi:hypothetical protein FYJ61_06645 [Lactobacillus equicursoris]|uniref:Uncharacterized protein n=1 Tax=Lactobacillus equicursoris TaxID=420645 RepID=A0A844FNE6_9LACO|nr:hypothetical protein [Lactobacillus equicursoris]
MESVDIFHLLWRSMNEKQKVECSNKLSLVTAIIIKGKCEQSVINRKKVEILPIILLFLP